MTVNGLTCPFTDLDYNLELCPDENNLVMVGCIVLTVVTSSYSWGVIPQLTFMTLAIAEIVPIFLIV